MIPIAIIGMAGIFPGAPDLRRFWNNIVDGVDAIGEVPPQRWDPLFYDTQSSAVDRFYCRRGGFIDDFADFDPLALGVMPKAANSADPEQLLTLRVGSDALADAGYATKSFARERTGVIIGRGNYLTAGTLRLEQHVRVVQQSLLLLQDLLPELDATTLANVHTQLRERLDYYGPDVAAGMIPNLVASRLAHRLNLHGPAYTVDAACASSLLAVEQACQLIDRGECELMLAGGVHLTHDLTFWATFCQLGAMSRAQTIKPFAADADGILAGEGVGVVVLKRADAARRDGDRIYAVINGVGSASDGRGAGLLAPSVAGQLLALQRAWQHTALTPAQLGLLEAHGTATPAGDQAELETLREFFGAIPANAADAPVIGSVKSMIGHAMPAAGIAGLIKAALSVYHGVRPPTLHCDQPHPLLAQTCFRPLAQAQPWPARERIAAVNAFGFGGINAHVILSSDALPVASIGAQQTLPLRVARIAAETQAELLDKLQRRDWEQAPGTGAWRIVIIEPDDERVQIALKIVRSGQRWHGRRHIYFSNEPLLQHGKVAFLFPGVDSHFTPHAQDIADYFGVTLPSYCKPLDPGAELKEVAMGVTQFNRFTQQILQRLNIRPDAVAGHSIGEWGAMAAAGLLDDTRIDAVISRVGDAQLQVPDAHFLAAACDAGLVRRLIAGQSEIVLSHDNCPHQVIACGRSRAIDTLQEQLRAQNILVQRLPIISGFHSPFFAEYLAPYRDFFLERPFAAPTVPIWSCTTAQPFPAASIDQQQLAVDHLVQPVKFRQLIENLYASGYRAFVQLGTGSLTGFAQDSLKNRPHLAIAANSDKHTGMEQLCRLSAALWVEGLNFNTKLLEPHTPIATTSTATSIKLALGVPLLRLEQALPASVYTTPVHGIATSAPVLGASNDPLQQHFAETLSDIQNISAEITALWQQRATAPAVRTGATARNERRHRLRLDLSDNIPYVLDHAFHRQPAGWPSLVDRRPVIPLTMEIALLREYVEREFPDYKVVRFDNVAAFTWLVVAQPVDIDIVIDPANFPQIDVRIEGYFSARITVAADFPPAPTQRASVLANLRPTAIDAEMLYCDGWMFHGPAYQGVRVLGPIADNGIRGQIKVPAGKGSLLDNMGQIGGYWVMEQGDDPLAMPIGVDTICFYAPEPAIGTTLDCEVDVRVLDAETCITDHQLVGADGRVIVEMHGWKTRRYTMSFEFYLRSKALERRIVGDAIGHDIVLFEDVYDTAVMREYLSRCYLNEIEFAQYEKLAPRRKRAWLNGRVAAKDAVRAYLWRKHGAFDLYPKEIRIDNTVSGAPTVTAHISNAFAETLHLSLSHKDRFAVAIVAEQPVGIDIERIEPRADDFMQLAFADAEQPFLPLANRDEWIARLWTAKEAAAKQRGTGLQGAPRDFAVCDVAEQRVLIGTQWLTTLHHHNYAIGWTDLGNI